MRSRYLRYGLGALSVSALLVGIFLFSLYSPASIEIAPPRPPAPESTEPEKPQTNDPGVRITANDRDTLLVEWQNLPDGTTRINIFRSPVGANRWAQWRSIAVGGGGSGSAELALGSKENLGGYSYYFQAISGNGDALYTSQTSQTQSGPSTPGIPSNQPSTPDSPLGTGFNFGMGSYGSSTPPQEPQNPLYNLSNLNTSTPPATATSPYNQSNVTTLTGLPTGTVTISMAGIYFNAQGFASGSGAQEAPFWVLHVNKNIELGWQNLPGGADTVVIFRSSSENGPWTEILRQTGVTPATPSFIRIVDGTLNAPYYYRMEARSGNTVLQTYGPVLLPALGG